MASPRAELAIRDGWRPPEEVTGTALRIGGGVPAGQGVMPTGYVGVDGLSYSRLPIETATWDPTMRNHDWEVWNAKQNGEAASPVDFVPAPAGSWDCTQIDVCQPCPESILHLPYCQPWGNRMEVECRQRDEAGRTTDSSTDVSRGWQQCGKVIADERTGFTQFVVLNSVLVILFFLLFLRRQHYLANKHSAALNERLNSH